MNSAVASLCLTAFALLPFGGFAHDVAFAGIPIRMRRLKWRLALTGIRGLGGGCFLLGSLGGMVRLIAVRIRPPAAGRGEISELNEQFAVSKNQSLTKNREP